ncbi:hypothetical protein F2P56_031767, partial [Juglans regia]
PKQTYTEREREGGREALISWTPLLRSPTNPTLAIPINHEQYATSIYISSPERFLDFLRFPLKNLSPSSKKPLRPPPRLHYDSFSSIFLEFFFQNRIPFSSYFLD